MRPSQPLVVVVHDNPAVCAEQANALTRAGYRCLVGGDTATAIWFAVRRALDPLASTRVVVVSPLSLPAVDLPASVVCLATQAAGAELVNAVAAVSHVFPGSVACS